MSVIDRLKHKFNGFEISTKITFAYAAFFVLLLALINFVMWLGFMNALFTPAERTIIISMVEVADLLKNLNDEHATFDRASFRKKLVTGVVLRVVDDNGNLIVDTDENYPSIDNFNSGIMKDPPLFADKELQISEFKNALIYCGTMRFEPKDDQGATLYFFKTITSELGTFHRMEKILFGIDAVGLILSLLAGFWLSRKILTPIKEMNEVAREIVFENMNGRIPIGSADDELAELGKTLNAMLDRLQAPIQSQQQFVSYASHELRTPATVFLGYVEILEKYGTDNPELMKESIDAIRSEANNLQSLLERISFLSRLDQHRLKIEKETLDLDDIVEEVMRKMTITVKSHEIFLLNNAPAKIFGDATLIRQMIRVFLENAVKYTPEGGSVKVSSRRDGKKVFLSIADSGIGIAPENQSKIFERYFRVNNENYKAKGSGLGLAMAKAIADLHDIKIRVESEHGRGTTFTLEIPVAETIGNA